MSDDRAGELRHAFDALFAAPAIARSDDRERFLALRIGGDRYALRMSEISGLATARRVVPLPGARAGLLGLAGIRGTLVPIYSLASSLGYPASEEPRWLALTGAGDRIGLAFQDLEGHLERPRADLRAAGDGWRAQSHVREVLHVDGAPRGILHLSSLLASLLASLPSTITDKE